MMSVHVKLYLLGAFALIFVGLSAFQVAAEAYDNCRSGWDGWHSGGFRGDFSATAGAGTVTADTFTMDSGMDRGTALASGLTSMPWGSKLKQTGESKDKQSVAMLACLKLALLLALFVAIMAMNTVEAARLLLDEYDNCRNGWSNWRNDGYSGDYYCNGRRWDRDGRYYDNGNWYGPGDRGGFGIYIGK
ncbi:hypothetical protein WJX81_001625 [Elliptochloris bilobata]|uniref:Uncharacterized protein n=1 Tax=Elliptochloris bilobata TaxID=381761 RepID=A0AAW1SCK8_9CHLO